MSAPDWNREVSKRIQRLQTIERFCGHIAEGQGEEAPCLYWWVENEVRAARELLDAMYRELGARSKGQPGSESVLSELNKRTLRLQTISQAASMLVDSGEAPAAVWLWISYETTAADRLIEHLWQACRQAHWLKPVG